MLQIDVNGLGRVAQCVPENWGELLNMLEQHDGGARRIVTAVRFSGVAVPTFRDPSALSRALPELGAIEVETATVDDLLCESAHSAYLSIAPLHRATLRLAERLRSGEELAAQRDLPELTASVQTLTTVTAVLAGARESVGPFSMDLDALVLRLCTVVDAIITRQARADWPAVCDVLERELLPTLGAWTSVVRRVWKLESR